MPVHINEIVIRANVVDSAEKSGTGTTQPKNALDKEEIIKECTEIILDILKTKNER
jgi:phenylpyruvate tautomerase PptA (4-oxalocrotonate tautomerase family)